MIGSGVRSLVWPGKLEEEENDHAYGKEPLGRKCFEDGIKVLVVL
jgi:hypothetical protein